jgi:hypothetical protein
MMRRFSNLFCSVIMLLLACPLPPAEGIGAAIRDRLLKAGNRE